MSGIEWTDGTWNPITGCTPVSTGCLNCYAATMANRLHGMTLAGREVPGYDQPLTVNRDSRQVFNGTVRCLDERLTEPMRWKKPRMVFVNSMSDLFHEAVPDEFIDRAFAVMALCPQHTFQILTKRPERMAEYLNQSGPFGSSFVLNRWYVAAQQIMDIDQFPQHRDWDWSMPEPEPLPNVWLGTSCEDQKSADERIPHLLRCPAAVRFLSCEPLLGAVKLPQCTQGPDCPMDGIDGHSDRPFGGIDWVIVGGESGPRARQCDVAWIRSIVGQCREAGVPVFVKQLGARPFERQSYDTLIHKVFYELCDRKGGDQDEWPEDLRVREMPGGVREACFAGTTGEKEEVGDE